MYEQCERCNIYSDETEVVNRKGSREPIRLCLDCREELDCREDVESKEGE